MIDAPILRDVVEGPYAEARLYLLELGAQRARPNVKPFGLVFFGPGTQRLGHAAVSSIRPSNRTMCPITTPLSDNIGDHSGPRDKSGRAP